MTDLLASAIALWHDCEPMPPHAGCTYTTEEHEFREAELTRLIVAIQAELKRMPVTRDDRGLARERITAAFVRFGRSALEFDDRHLDLLLGGGFSGIATALARRARRFDATVSMADILQASRNAWTACGLQTLFGGRMELTTAIFAYSMLYPYSDNYVDDPSIEPTAKLRFSERFGQRLRGESQRPESGIEEAIWRLIALIEEQYPRAAFPQVFESLLAIHHAQERSILLLRTGDVDVVGLSFEKGGTSVLADVFLAVGSPAEAAASFAFVWGVLLQLGDDLQDVADDLASGRRTVFSEAAERGPLDHVTSRTLRFGEIVLGRLETLGDPGTETLRELMRRSSRSLLVRAAGQASDLYTPEYLRDLERFSPFRFGFLQECRRRLGRQTGSLARLFEAFLAGDEDEPAFPLLPASLMQHL